MFRLGQNWSVRLKRSLNPNTMNKDYGMRYELGLKEKKNRLEYLFSAMRNYFYRLPTLPSDREILNTVMRNLHPYYLDRLCLQEITSLSDLIEKGRRIEENRWRIKTHKTTTAKEVTSRTRSSLHPS
ncbi:hypothetical protein O3M35_005925 [Rhynocoris fuscipes]|uniref:Maturase K n=1 Tax=Rhynocoris fuscipes TaxID=488301 RepID=A0AAW1DBE9_9HEMI